MVPPGTATRGMSMKGKIVDWCPSGGYEGYMSMKGKIVVWC